MDVRVLVLDDDFRVAAVHAAVAGRVPGCQVVGLATTVTQARELLAQGGVDLIVADEYLPDGSGTDLIGVADASVLLVTAADDPATMQRALVRGAFGYLIKPFGLQSLADRLADYVNFREALSRVGPHDQSTIDEVLGRARRRPHQAASSTPKGRSAVTAVAVSDLLRDSPGPLTAMAVAEAIGISRATAQRYLADLVDAGEVQLSLRYGTAGRPEHRYALTKR